MENDSKGSSLDLLSAALNQSGLINCVENDPAIDLSFAENVHNGLGGSSQNETEKVQLDSISAFANQPVKNSQVNCSNLQPSANLSKVLLSKAISKNFTSVTTTSTSVNSKVMTIPNAKIIKLPALKAGSIIKINKVIRPSAIQIKKPNTSVIPSVHNQVSASITVSDGSPSQTTVLTSNGTCIKTVVGDEKAIFIPILKSDDVKKTPIKLIQHQASLQKTTLSNSVSTSSNLKNVNLVKKRENSSSELNLGSMFVESAEKAVSSDIDTPPGSPFTLVLTDEVKMDGGNVHIKGNTSNQSRKNNSTFINGTKYVQRNAKLTSSTSIPTIRLSINNHSPTDDQSKSYHGKEKLLRSMSLPVVNKRLGEELVAEDEKEEEMQHTQTYSEYMPSKLQIGLPHPDSVVETSSLASITPPEVYYQLSLPKQTIDLGHLSALQLESIVYACQKHETFLQGGERSGFLIGDGAGVGKGRSIAGIIFENYLVGRKRALWFSVSNDLKFDAERDLQDIGAKHIKVYSLNKFKYGKITHKNNGAVKKGVIFATYSSLIGESHSQAKYHTRLKQLLHWCGENFDGPIIFDECHKAKNLLPSGSGKSTKTGVTVLELQNQLPNARVVYASATGASEPRNMAYMSRLGLWGPGTPFNDFLEFIQAVERRGVGAMELVAMDMKLRGCYIARQLSFYGVSFKIEEVSLDPAFVSTYNRSVRLWVAAREAFQVAASMMEAEYHMKKSMWAQFWSAHQRFFKYLCLSAKVKHTVSLVREAVKHGKCVVIGLQSTGEAGTVDELEKHGGELDEFVSTAKTVFANVVERHFPAPDRKRVAALLGRDFYKKPESEVELTKKRKNASEEEPLPKKNRKDSSSNDDSSSHDSSDDIALISDDEEQFSDDSRLSEEDIGRIFQDDSDSDDNSPVKKSKIETNSEDEEDGGLKMEVKEDETDDPSDLLSTFDSMSGTPLSALPGMGSVEKAQALKKELLMRLKVLAPSLPNNMLDELIDALGGTDNVAEMTGRKGRVISTDEGNVRYESRSEADVPVELLNVKEKQRFMAGEKNIAIISEAASSGISLQADKRVRNQRKRVHVTVELPWSADRAVQQFGRTHRSNQVNAPEYVFLITELAGEQRFASVVAKRLESLGALTHGDRRATESRDLSKYNYDNKYGRKALDAIMKAIAGYDPPLVPPPQSYKGNFFKDIRQGLLGVGLLTRETGQVHYQLDKDYNNIFKFMNRILGMEVEQQNAIFTFFLHTLTTIINEAKRIGEYDQGIMDVGLSNNSVEPIKCKEFPLVAGGSVSLHTVRVERGTSWEEAERLHRSNSAGGQSGFFITFQKRNERHMVMLALECFSRRHRSLFLIYRPNTGKQVRRESLDDIEKKYQRVDEEEARKWWDEQFHASLDQCSHEYWQGSCNRDAPTSCTVGKRRRMYHVLSGSVLQVWKTVEYVLASEGGYKFKMQIVRLKTSDGGKLVGLLVPSLCVASLTSALNEASQPQPHIHPQTINPHFTHVIESSDDDVDEYEEVDPDHMLSSVLFSRKQFSWS